MKKRSASTLQPGNSALRDPTSAAAAIEGADTAAENPLAAIPANIRAIFQETLFLEKRSGPHTGWCRNENLLPRTIAAAARLRCDVTGHSGAAHRRRAARSYFRRHIPLRRLHAADRRIFNFRPPRLATSSGRRFQRICARRFHPYRKGRRNRARLENS